MTARYRCPWCGLGIQGSWTVAIKHILETHRRVILEGLGVIETFGTPDREIVP